jgi:hypothetical protein
MATEILEVEVQSNIKGVTKDVKDLGKSVKKTKDETEDLGDAAESGASGFNNVGTAVRAVGTAMKALGIGMIIAAFIALKEAFMRNQKAADFMNTSMTAISIAFNEVVDIIIEMVEWIGKNEEKLDSLKKTMSAFWKLGILPFKQAIQTTEFAIRMFGNSILVLMNSLGAKNTRRMNENQAVIRSLGKQILKTGKQIKQAAIDVYENFGDATTIVGGFFKTVVEKSKRIKPKEILNLARSITEAEKAARAAAVEIQGMIDKSDLLAETERRNRDDITKTYEDRIAASDKLLGILETQEEQMMKLAKKRTEAARLASEANSENLDLELAHQEALNEEKAIEAQINGFLTEQLMAHNALIKEEIEVKEEVRIEAMSGREKELAEIDAHYKALKKKANDVGADTTAIDKKWSKAKSDIAREGVNAQLEAFSGLAKGLSALAGDNKALAVASALIDTYVGANKAFAQGGVIGYVTAAGVIAAGLANVSKILQTEVPDAGGGGGAAPAPAPEPPSPQMMSGAFSLEGGTAVEPARAYVVSDDITDSQDKLAIIRRRATI